MKSKTLTAIMCGVMVAALVCIVVGLIIYFSASGIVLDKSSADYASLAQQRSLKLAIGTLVLSVGCSAFIFPSVVLIIILIVNIVSAAKSNKK